MSQIRSVFFPKSNSFLISFTGNHGILYKFWKLVQSESLRTIHQGLCWNWMKINQDILAPAIIPWDVE